MIIIKISFWVSLVMLDLFALWISPRILMALLTSTHLGKLSLSLSLLLFECFSTQSTRCKSCLDNQLPERTFRLALNQKGGFWDWPWCHDGERCGGEGLAMLELINMMKFWNRQELSALYYMELQSYCKVDVVFVQRSWNYRVVTLKNWECKSFRIYTQWTFL